VSNSDNFESFGNTLIIAPGEIFGGAERHIFDFIEYMYLHDMPMPTILLLNDSTLANKLQSIGVAVSIVPDQNLRKQITHIRQLVQSNGIRLVHLHGYKATILATLSGVFSTSKLIKTEHGRPEPVAGTILQRMRQTAINLTDVICTHLLDVTVVYVSKDLLHQFRRRHVRLNRHVIPNGVTVRYSETKRSPYANNAGEFNVLCLGRLEPIKGLEYAISAMSLDSTPVGARLQIVGTGPLRKSLEQFAAEKRVTHRVCFHGFQENVSAYLQHCDVLLLPSIHEGTPYSLLEALASAKPSIVTEVGGMKDLIESGETGIFVAPKRPDQISLAIRQLYENPTLRQRIATKGQAKQRASFSIKTMAKSYFTLYQQLLDC
jgi:glycosyltransferase involved in cell wall biosynthesis